MSKDRPAHARPDAPARRTGQAEHAAPAAEGPGAGGTGADGPGGDGVRTQAGSPLAVALRDLAPPRHGTTFWNDLDARLADEPQLRLAPRSAIRPITQPPPVTDDGSLASRLKVEPTPRPRSSRRTVVAVVVGLLVVLLVAAALFDPDDETTTSTDGTTEQTDSRAPTTEEAAAPADTAPPETAPAGAIDDDEMLTSSGVAPLAVGTRLADLQAIGVVIQVDDETFRGSGGSCYDARVEGALDLALRFRAPDGQSSVDDPGDGVLTAVAIESGLPTSRTTDSGLALGAPQEQVLAAYGGNLDETSHPFVSGGRIFRADAGDGTGVAFFTDGLGVIRIAVGELEAIRFVNQCR
jgi:hypothetical protein